MQLNLADPFPFESLPAFRDLLELSRSERPALYGDPAWLSRARSEVNARWSHRWSKTCVQETQVHQGLVGIPLTELGKSRGVDPWDLMVELSLAEDLATRFHILLYNDNEADIEYMLHHPLTLLGLSDAGAHASQLCDACFPTYLLEHWVRESGSLRLEDAVWRLTGQPAAAFRLEGRGALASGFYGDVTIFDPTTVGPGKAERVYDLPSGADRLVVPARGIEHVLVNGEFITRSGEALSGVGSGRMLRSCDNPPSPALS